MRPQPSQAWALRSFSRRFVQNSPFLARNSVTLDVVRWYIAWSLFFLLLGIFLSDISFFFLPLLFRIVLRYKQTLISKQNKNNTDLGFLVVDLALCCRLVQTTVPLLRPLLVEGRHTNNWRLQTLPDVFQCHLPSCRTPFFPNYERLPPAFSEPFSCHPKPVRQKNPAVLG